MDYKSHMEKFWSVAELDTRLHSPHLVLYLALCQVWSKCCLVSPFIIQRKELMRLARIGSRVTYYRCMRELHRYGFIRYAPSYDYYRGSFVTILPITENQWQQIEVPNLALK